MRTKPVAGSSESQKNFPPDLFAELAETEDHHFWFRTRRYVIGSLMAEVVTGFPPGYRVLEVGCGTGNVLRAAERVCRRGVVIGMDLFAEALFYAHQRSSSLLVQGDLYALPFRAVFHLIGLFDVLEHLSDDLEVLRDLGNLLVPEGKLLLTVPARKSLWSYFDETARHRRRYEPDELREKLERAGYRVEYLTYYMAVTFPLIWGWRRLAAVAAKHTITTERGRELLLGEYRIAPILNELIRLLLVPESLLIKRRKILPIGTSLVALCRKRP